MGRYGAPISFTKTIMQRGRQNITNRISIILILSLFSIAAACGFFFLNEYRIAQEEMAEYTGLQDNYTTVLTETTQDESSDDGEVIPGIVGMPYVAADFDALLAINPETVGWLAIPGTEISYPVMKADNNSKYLNTSFSGQRSNAGAIFMDCGNSVNPLDQNSIVYGHNMGRGRTDMFGALLEYKELAYYDSHASIQFDTIYRNYGWWKVFAVVSLDAKTSEFDYLRQKFSGAFEFETWLIQAKALSLYDTGVTAEPGDKILTLSTCDRSVSKNGRLLVMAVLSGGDEP
jgi:sortase B